MSMLGLRVWRAGQFCFAFLVAAAICTNANASMLIQGGVESQTAISYSSNFMQGYDFTANSNLTVEGLGFWDSGSNGLGRSFQVGLWDTATEVLLASAIIDDGDAIDGSVVIEGGSYRFESLASAVALTSGQTYTLGWQMGASVNAADSLFITDASLVTNPLVTVGGNRDFRFESTPVFQFPSNTSSSLTLFRANVNARFGVVPEPTSMALMGFGIVGCGFMAHRKRRRS